MLSNSRKIKKRVPKRGVLEGGGNFFQKIICVVHEHDTYLVSSCSLDLGEHFKYPQRYVLSNRKNFTGS